MITPEEGPKDGRTRLSYILGAPLADHCIRQWPQMGELIKGRDLIAKVEENFGVATLEVGRRLALGSSRSSGGVVGGKVELEAGHCICLARRGCGVRKTM